MRPPLRASVGAFVVLMQFAGLWDVEAQESVGRLKEEVALGRIHNPQSRYLASSSRGVTVSSYAAPLNYSYERTPTYGYRGLVPAMAEGDTSKLMHTLYGINTFMEWYMIWFPVPFGSYSAETSMLFGMSKYNAFTMRRHDKLDTVTLASSVSAFAYYTLNRQYKFVLESNLMLNKNKALWKTDLIYVHYPLLYYGVGNDTDLANRRTLESSDIEVYMHYLFRVWKKWYVGPAIDFDYYYEVGFDEDSQIFPGDSAAIANNLGRQSGLGIKLSMEGRDNRLNGKHGFFVEASYMFYDKAFGSEFNFKYLQADLRYYTTPFEKLTIAAQVRTSSKIGDVPVQSLSLLGGDYAMRGLYIGRYRDKVLVDSQVELRFPIFWILGGTVFSGAGQVAPGYSDLAFDRFHYTYGLGLRLKVDSQHDVNLRMDLGFSSDQTIFIMNFSEAF